MEHARHFVNRLDEEETWLDWVRSVMWDAETIVAAAAEGGYDFTAEEFDLAMDEAWGIFAIEDAMQLSSEESW